MDIKHTAIKAWEALVEALRPKCNHKGKWLYTEQGMKRRCTSCNRYGILVSNNETGPKWIGV